MRRPVGVAAIVAVLVALLLVESPPSPVAAESFPGVNGLIAFTSNRDGNDEIYVMAADGSGQTRLTTNAVIDDLPSWSPDGSRIAFTSERDDGYFSEVYVMAADGSDQTRLTTSLGADYAYQPAWSPDGSRIAYLRYGTTNGLISYDMWVRAADGSGQDALTGGQDAEFDPAWSPDGTRIVFTGLALGAATSGLWVMNADGSGQARLTTAGPDDGDPSWQPNAAPVAAGDTAATVEESAVTVEVLANDVDPDGDPVGLVSVGAAAHGSTAVFGTPHLASRRPRLTGTHALQPGEHTSIDCRLRYPSTAPEYPAGRCPRSPVFPALFPSVLSRPPEFSPANPLVRCAQG